jgi:AdoMet-dependent heme synthase
MMRNNRGDYPAMKEPAQELGASFRLDPITPHINGDHSLLALNIPREDLKAVIRTRRWSATPRSTAPPAPVTGDDLDTVPCSAGHSSCYISPHSDVYSCVQFPLPSGDIRRQRFIDIWRNSPKRAEVLSIRTCDLPVCSTCIHVLSHAMPRPWPGWRPECRFPLSRTLGRRFAPSDDCHSNGLPEHRCRSWLKLC